MAITVVSQFEIKGLSELIAQILSLPDSLVLDDRSQPDISTSDTFIRVAMVSATIVGDEYKFDDQNNREIITMTHETVIAINAYGTDSYAMIARLCSGLRTSLALTTLKRLGLGLVKKSSIRYLATDLATNNAQRTQIELTFSHIHRITTQIYASNTVEITTNREKYK